MSFIGAENDASVICEDTLRSIRDYLKNTHGKKNTLSGIISQEDGNYSGINLKEMQGWFHVTKFRNIFL